MAMMSIIPLLIMLVAFAAGIAFAVVGMIFMLKGIKALEVYIKKTELDIKQMENK